MLIMKKSCVIIAVCIYLPTFFMYFKEEDKWDFVHYVVEKFLMEKYVLASSRLMTGMHMHQQKAHTQRRLKVHKQHQQQELTQHQQRLHIHRKHHMLHLSMQRLMMEMV